MQDHSSTTEQGLRTLAIDVGGSGLKMLILDHAGEPVTERLRVLTPRPAEPTPVIAALVEMASSIGAFHRVSVGFPGVVVGGVIHSAPNLDGEWAGVDLATQLAERLDRPTRVANDADVQGFGAIAGEGVELAVTLGTGFGSALFVDGTLVPNLEMGHHPFKDGLSYEMWLGKAGRKERGRQEWNAALLEAIETLERLFNYRRLYIGGGDAKKIDVELGENVEVVSNQAGLLGGIALWR